jgi:hypothetical protein
MACIRAEQAQTGRLIRQVGYMTLTAKTKKGTISTNLTKIVYVSSMMKESRALAKISGWAKGTTVWCSGVVSAGSVTFIRLTAGTVSAPAFWYELLGYP